MNVNPYAPPTQSDIADSHFYKTVIQNLRVGELWRITRPNPVSFTIGLILKVFRQSLRLDNAFAFADLMRIDFNDVPRTVSEYFDQANADFRAVGYSPTFSAYVPMLGEGEVYAQVHIGPQSDRVSGCLYGRTVSGVVEDVTTALSISSRTTDGVIHTSTTLSKHLDPPPSVNLSFRKNANVYELNQSHSSFVRDLPRNSLVEINADTAWQLLKDNAKLELDFNVNRGLQCPITDEEFAHLRSRACSTEQSDAVEP